MNLFNFNRLKFRYPIERPDRVPMPDKAGRDEYERRRELALDKHAFDHVHISWFADGLFYNDLREPFITAPLSPATLLTTATALYLASNFPVLGGQYWARVGKKLKIRLAGAMTSDGTAANFSWYVYYGTGASANGTSLMPATTAVAGVTGATALPWCCEVYVSCRSIGASGTLWVNGWSEFALGLLLSTNAPIMIPNVTPAVSGSVDLTAANIIGVQAGRSGAGVWTMTINDMDVIAMN